jgi:hypothetical protein
MPFAINGFGTAYCGQCEFRSDDSFVTTEWITVFYVPAIPLRSFRLIRAKDRDVNVVIYRSESYDVLETLPVCWAQVLRVYLFLFGAVAWWALLVWLFFFKLAFMSGSNVPLIMTLMLIFVSLMGMPLAAIVWMFRKNSARRQSKGAGIPRSRSLN